MSKVTHEEVEAALRPYSDRFRDLRRKRHHRVNPLFDFSRDPIDRFYDYINSDWPERDGFGGADEVTLLGYVTRIYDQQNGFTSGPGGGWVE